MSLPGYPEYRDSGIAWLGEVPAHWEVMKSRRMFFLRNERAHEGDEQLTASQKHGVIYQRDYVEREGQKVMQVITGADILKHVEPGDFVISMRSFQGGIEWCGRRGCISSAYVMLIPDLTRVLPSFFSYLLKSWVYIQALQSTTNLVRDGQALRYDNFTQIDLPVVPLDEQRQIAAFLDREIVKIDTLVAEQEKLIALLKEKRHALISHAVTKGLDPTVSMKDSGVEWLGQVPAHWVPTKIKYIASFKGGGTPSREKPEYWEGDIPWVSPKDMKVETISTTEETISEQGLDSSATSRVEAGAVLMVVRSGILRHTIPVAENALEVALNQDMKAVRFEPSTCLSMFFIRWVQGLNDRLLLLWAKQGATVESIEHEYLAGTLFSLPPLPEQATIAAFLDREVTHMDALVTEAQRAIDLLKERRTALISAAVTGKIDVRGLGAALPPSAELEPA